MVDQTISHYKILEKIGQGGMGEIYKAKDTRLDRIVALKLLPPYLTRDPDAKDRFVREARAASQLEHPNICTVFEIDETADGQCFITMSYCEGLNLKARIKQKPLAVEEAVDIAVQTARGLDKAHKKGIVHRDIKPANIMITDDGIVKIVDFGLAKLTAQTKLTREGVTLGTIAYMSPEQAEGEEIDRRTDIWSLGAVLYEMLTGQIPFKGEYEQAVIYSIINENPPPVTALRSGIPMELQRIVDKCLEKNPADRYQHADELIVDLHRLKKESESKSKPADRSFEKKVPGSSRFKSGRLLTVAIFLIIILLIAGYFVISQLPRPDRADLVKSIAVLPFDDLSPDRDQEYFCDGMTEQITTNLSRLEQIRVRGRNSVMKFKNTDKTIPQIAGELNVRYLLEGSIRKAANRIRVTVQLIKAEDDYHLWANDYDRELDDVLNVQDDIARAVSGILLTKLSAEDEQKIRTARPANNAAYEYYLKGKYYHNTKFFNSGDMEDFTAAEKMLLKAIELDSNYTPAYTQLADLYNTYHFMRAKTDEEKDKFMKLQEHYLGIAYRLDPGSAEINRVQGSIYDAKRELEKAYYYLKRSVELDQNDIYNNFQFGQFLSMKGLYNLGVKYLLRVIEIDPLEISAYAQLAAFYWNMGQLDQAENYYKKALEMDPHDVISLHYYARVLYDLKKYDQFRAIRLQHEQLDSDSTRRKYLRALQYILEGEKDKALKTYVKPDPDVSTDFFIMRLYDHFGMHEEFIRYLEEDFERIKKRDELSFYLWLKNATLYDNLRAYPRFQQLLEKHKQLYELNLKKYKDID
jgi:serine/threonine protein kinase/Tfp pilus assembly protein PilF